MILAEMSNLAAFGWAVVIVVGIAILFVKTVRWLAGASEAPRVPRAPNVFDNQQTRRNEHTPEERRALAAQAAKDEALAEKAIAETIHTYQRIEAAENQLRGTLPPPAANPLERYRRELGRGQG